MYSHVLVCCARYNTYLLLEVSNVQSVELPSCWVVRVVWMIIHIEVGATTEVSHTSYFYPKP